MGQARKKGGLRHARVRSKKEGLYCGTYLYWAYICECPPPPPGVTLIPTTPVNAVFHPHLTSTNQLKSLICSQMMIQ